MNQTERSSSKSQKIGEEIGVIFFLWLVILIMATLTGLWVKFFWIGWVLVK